jgi:hypothetical protein
VRSWHPRCQSLHACPHRAGQGCQGEESKAVSKKQVAGIGMVRKLIAAVAGYSWFVRLSDLQDFHRCRSHPRRAFGKTDRAGVARSVPENDAARLGGDSAPQQSWKIVPTENVSFRAFPIHCCRRRRYISGRKHLLPKEARRVKFTGYLRCPIDGPKSWMRRRSNVARRDTKTTIRRIRQK